MASVQPAPTPQQLCSYCHRKPKFNNFEYCGKTCAKEAKQAVNSNLCNYCHQKPKFANHEFCGKKCATSAAAVTQTTPKANTNGGASTGSSAKGTPTAPPPAPVSLPVTLQSGQVIDVADLARTIIQQIPQLQALISGGNGQSQPVNVNQIAAQLASMLAPGSQTGTAVPGQTNGTSPTTSFVTAVSQLPPSPTVFSYPVDYTVSGRSQDEEPEFSLNSPTLTAVNSPTFSQKSLCIMCGMEPQTYYYYFCGDECRDNALHKYGED